MSIQGENDGDGKPLASPASSGETPYPSKQLELEYDKLPNLTSIRLLDVIQSTPDGIRCEMRIVDLDDNPEYAALSYTWGNPVTVHEEPVPDIENLRYPEDIEKFPFAYTTPSLGPNGETFIGIDGVKKDYLSRYANIPFEKVDWTSGTPRLVQVNGYAVHVEENLFLYLESIGHMRAKFAEKLGNNFDYYYNNVRLPLWIDALCINQADLTERAAQVQLMGRIFKSATIVFAWIGQSDRLSTIAFQAMEFILDCESTRSEAIRTWTRESGTEPPRFMEMSLTTVPKMTVVHWFALFSLLQRLWFRRAWIAQEIIFAKNVLIVCSGDMVTMTLFLTVFAFIEEHGLEYDLCRLGRSLLTGQPLSEAGRYLTKLATFAETARIPQDLPTTTSRQLEVDPKDAFSFVLGFHRVRGRLGLSEAGMPLMGQKLVDEGKLVSWDVEIPKHIKLSDNIMVEVEPGVFKFYRRPLRLLSVLSDFRSLDATDPRDKIFAFLNLATDNLGLVPDYGAKVQDVFRTAAETIMKATGALSVLSHVQAPSETKVEDLPGWVPDFSARVERAPFDEGGEECRFCTSSVFRSANIVFNMDGTLGVNGFRIDTVSSVADLEGDAILPVLQLALKVPAQYPGSPLAWWMFRVGDRGHRELRPQAVNRVEALWRTLIADQLTEKERESDHLDSKASLSAGFVSWILADMLEAFSLFIKELEDPDSVNWMKQLTCGSFIMRMSLWSAVYDERQISNFTINELSGLGNSLDDFRDKKENEKDQYQLDQHLGNQSPRMGLEHFPTAHQIAACFQTLSEETEQDEDQVGTKYRTDTLRKLTLAERRQLQNFEMHMRKATNGRLLFSTEAGRLGLGPRWTGVSSECTDEIWILGGARVPLILRWDKENQYRIIGEAYVHGIMYGEETGETKEIRLV